MIEYVKGNEAAVIVLHEIYGINWFIEEQCRLYHRKGFDVFCPNLLKREQPFSYAEQEEAYCFFTERIGYDCYLEIDELIAQLKGRYQKVILVGFSVGGATAWRCSENPLCDGVVCFYGSRIRDYLSVQPKCQTLLIFAERDSFDVADVARRLERKDKLAVEIVEAGHGFYDRHSESYNKAAAVQAEQMLINFLNSQ